MSYQEVIEKYQPTIGIECHVQLKTKTKLFSGADNDATDKGPNTVVSPICYGAPGVLPVLNEHAVKLAVRAGLAMNADVPALSRFERKHYFYPDLPKGYQITQLAEPVIIGGSIEVPQVDGTTKTVKLHHTHLEEDAGKLTHPGVGNYSLVDLNRAGTPLIEIVSEPDIHSPQEAKAYAQELYLLMTYAGVTNGDLYHGNMRFDVNISLAPRGVDTLGIRAEIKNLNSFRSVEKAAEYECLRQAAILDAGEAVIQETRGWSEAKQKTVAQRSKEEAHDYRYMPEPDIPPLRISEHLISQIKQELPLLPSQYRDKWSDLSLDQSVVNALLQNPAAAQLVYDCQDVDKKSAIRIAHWFASALGGEDTGIRVAAQLDGLIELANMVEANQISSTNAKELFIELVQRGGDPRQLAEARSLLQTNDTAQLEGIVDEMLAHPTAQKAIEDIRSGNEKAIGFLVGQAMKMSRGQGNPALFQQLIRDKLQVGDK